MSRVDRDTKVIHGYSVMSLGEAKGHGFAIDDTTLDQLVALGNADAASGGKKTRVRHPSQTDDGFGRYLGQSRNFRRDGARVVADLHLSQAAFVSPEGDFGTYIMARAEEGGAGFGASPEIEYTLEKTGKGRLPAARLKSLPAIAVVDDPATNSAFFCCLSKGDEAMADNADTNVAELTAERDLLAGEVARLKAEATKLSADLTAKGAELQVAKAEATTAAITTERARIGDVLALCSKAGKADLSARYIADGTAVGDVQKALLEVLCAKNGTTDAGGAEGGAGEKDENALLKAEYAADRVLLQRAGISESDYLTSRRISAGEEMLVVRN